MAFLQEDGTGLAAANSYNSIAEFQTHHVDRGQIDSASEFTDAEIQQALINATDYIEKRFSRSFRGWTRSRDQRLSWPRNGAHDDDGYLFGDLPNQLKDATNEYALIAARLGRNLAPVPPPDFGVTDLETGEVTNEITGSVTLKKEKVGPIEEVTQVGTSGGNSVASKGAPTVKLSSIVSMIPEYPQADLWLEELLVSTTSRTLSRG